DRHRPLRLSEIADRERASPPTATTVIQRLAEEGLVERSPDPTPSRSSRLRPPRPRSAQLAACREHLAAGVGGLLEPLSAPDPAAVERASGTRARLVHAPDG